MLWQQCAHWAEVDPTKLAIVTPRAGFTYAKLSQSIDRVASAVLKEQTGCTDLPMRVLVFFADPFGLVSAAIGIEKSGGCHVILNPATPNAFLEQISADVNPAMIITEARLVDRARKLVGDHVPLVIIESLNETEPPSPGACSLDDLHSLLYTSGSSGRPKGVMHSRYFEAFAVARDLGSALTLKEDKVLCASALGSGMGRRVVRNALVVGATLYLPDLTSDWPTQARRWLDSVPITFLGTLPSLMRVLFNSTASSHRFEHLQIISIAGEAVRRSDFELFKRHTVPGTIFSNGYGASEGGIYSLGALDHDAMVTTPLVPMGKALSFVEVSIVDGQGQPLPPDQPGEIVLRSPMTADAYWKMPELSAKKFLPDPDGGRRRIFRTGDLGTIGLDGTIMHLGRVDDEVKVNGNRVSIPLVENAMLGCPGIQNAVVQLHTRDHDGSACLAGYYVASTDDRSSPATIREHLHERLPAYMVPSYLTRLESIPLNATGKVDRFALPKPDEAQRGSDQPFVAPRSEIEKQIAAIWGKILGVERVGVDDRFSDLGGDSLQAVRMLIEVNRELKTVLDIPALNQVRTISELAKLISSNAQAHRYPSHALLKTGTGPPLFLFHAVGGNILVYQPLAAKLSGEMPIYGILAPGLNADRKPLESVPEIATHHISLMKAIQPTGPYYFGGYSFGGIVAFEVARQLHTMGEEVGIVFVLDARVRIPKSLSFAQRLRKRVAEEARRVVHHLKYFATHRPSEWRAYAQELVRRAQRVQRNATLRRRQEAGFHEQVNRYLDEVDQLASPTIQAVIDAHHIALWRFRPAPYTGDVTVALARETNFEGINAWKEPWQEAVQGTLEFIEVPGDHRTMMYEPNIDVLADRLNPILAKARERAKSPPQAPSSPHPHGRS